MKKQSKLVNKINEEKFLLIEMMIDSLEELADDVSHVRCTRRFLENSLDKYEMLEELLMDED